MANIQINDLQNETVLFSKSSQIEFLKIDESSCIYGGISEESGFFGGIGLVGTGIGIVAMGLGPIGMLAGGFVYGFGLGLAMYSGYGIGSGGWSRFQAFQK